MEAQGCRCWFASSSLVQGTCLLARSLQWGRAVALAPALVIDRSWASFFTRHLSLLPCRNTSPHDLLASTARTCSRAPLYSHTLILGTGPLAPSTPMPPMGAYDLALLDQQVTAPLPSCPELGTPPCFCYREATARAHVRAVRANRRRCRRQTERLPPGAGIADLRGAPPLLSPTPPPPP